MKLNVVQRTKLFEIVRKNVLRNLDKVEVISSDIPNMSFVYNDDDYEVLYYHNWFGTGEVVQISLYNKKLDESVKFDTGDYMFMKDRLDLTDLVNDINEHIFDADTTDTEDSNLIDKILGI